MNSHPDNHDTAPAELNHPPGQTRQTAILAALVLLPLLAIAVQLALDLKGRYGTAGYLFYKLCFLIPPLIYCRVMGISLFRDIFKFHNWRRYLKVSASLGGLAVLIFWGAYFLLGDLLLDKDAIVTKIESQFSVNANTVLLIAPITMFLNSLLEEFFYRGFSFGLLVKRQRLLGYLLPAAVFTIQHIMFIYHWATLLPLAIAVVALFVFALVLQRIYEQADTLVAPWLIHMFGDLAMMGIAATLVWRALG